MRFDWPSAAMGVVTALVSGLMIAWATPLLQTREPPRVPLVYDAETAEVAGGRDLVAADEEGDKEFISYITIHNTSSNAASDFEIMVNVQVSSSDILAVARGRSLGAFLAAPLNKSSIDENEILHIKYSRFGPLASDTIIIKSKTWTYPIAPSASDNAITFTNVHSFISQSSHSGRLLKYLKWFMWVMAVLSILWLGAGIHEKLRKRSVSTIDQ